MVFPAREWLHRVDSGPLPTRATTARLRRFRHSRYDDRTAGWTLSRPSLARVAGYDLMDGGDDIINAIRHGPPSGDIV